MRPLNIQWLLCYNFIHVYFIKFSNEKVCLNTILTNQFQTYLFPTFIIPIFLKFCNWFPTNPIDDSIATDWVICMFAQEFYTKKSVYNLCLVFRFGFTTMSLVSLFLIPFQSRSHILHWFFWVGATLTYFFKEWIATLGYLEKSMLAKSWLDKWPRSKQTL